MCLNNVSYRHEIRHEITACVRYICDIKSRFWYCENAMRFHAPTQAQNERKFAKKFGLNRALRRSEAQMCFQSTRFFRKIGTESTPKPQRTSLFRFICPIWAQFRDKTIKEHKKFWCNVVPTSRHSCIRHSRQNLLLRSPLGFLLLTQW